MPTLPCPHHPELECSVDRTIFPGRQSILMEGKGLADELVYNIKRQLNRIAEPEGLDLEIVAWILATDILEEQERRMENLALEERNRYINRDSYDVDGYINGFSKVEEGPFIFVLKWDGKIRIQVDNLTGIRAFRNKITGTIELKLLVLNKERLAIVEKVLKQKTEKELESRVMNHVNKFLGF